MLIINNGYGKSGTTWIQRGLHYYFRFRRFDPSYQNPALANASIAPEKILSFVQSVDILGADYYSKSHWAANQPIEADRLAQALPTLPGVVVINSIRNVGDSTVSWYHHQKRDGDERDFETWFWAAGTTFVHRYMSHHMSWAQTSRPPFLFSYEAMKHDPFAAFQRFRAQIGLDDDRPAEAFNHHMDFNVSKAQSKSQHMRKGVVGDRVNYLTPDMVAHIEAGFAKRRFFDKCADYFAAYDIVPEALMPGAESPAV